ncbi:MAG: hypothetical protein WCC22_19890 [Terriglobales bacterium]
MRFSKVFILTVVLALLAIPLAAQTSPSHTRHCSLATLKGSYGFFGEAPALLTGDPTLRIAIVGITHFDGHGNLSGESIGNVEGWGAGEVGKFRGTYTVNPDCTYSGEHTGDDGETLHFTGTITGSGMLQGTRFVVTDPGWVALGTDKKIRPEGCSLSTLEGSYALFGGGTVTALDPPAQIAHVGTVTYDGAGRFVGTDTIMLDGTTVPDTFTGTYTVTKECMISMEVASTAVGVIHEVGWIVGDGKSTEVRLILTDPGFLAFDATRKQ